MSATEHRLRDLLRRRAGGEALTDPLDDELEVLASTDSAAAEARRDLGKLLDQLPDRHRQTIVDGKRHGRSVAEAALLTGISESAINVGIHRGLKALSAKIRAGTREDRGSGDLAGEGRDCGPSGKVALDRVPAERLELADRSVRLRHPYSQEFFTCPYPSSSARSGSSAVLA